MNLLEDKEFIEFQGLQESANLVQFSDIKDDIKKRFEQRSSGTHGDPMPWPKTHDKIRLRPGEVSLWSGINKHGKSLVLGQTILWMPYEIKSLIASLEMPVAATAERMVQQTLPSGSPTDHYIDLWVDATNNIWIYDEMQTVQTHRMIALVNYAGQILGVDHMVIDSLVKCGLAPDDYPRQKAFVDALCQLAKAYQMHIHLVHHMRKGDKEAKEPDKFDIKGAGEITDLVDNIFIIHRNKEKEKKVQNGQHVDEMEPDMKLICAGQRHGDWEGFINLWHDKNSHQFMGGPHSRLRWRLDI
jgi:twinkle protein